MSVLQRPEIRSAPPTPPPRRFSLVRRILRAPKRVFSAMGRALSYSRVPEMSPELRDAVSRFVREELLEDWLRLPNKMLGGKSPAELLRKGQEKLIFEAIDQARRGEGS